MAGLNLAVFLWLLACAVQDVDRRTVSNWLTLPAVLVAGGLRLTGVVGGSWPITGLLTVLLLGGWGLHQIGGADVKGLLALALLDIRWMAWALGGVGVWYLMTWIRHRQKPTSLPGFAGFALGVFVPSFLSSTHWLIQTTLSRLTVQAYTLLTDERGDFAQVALFLALVVIVAIGALTILGGNISGILQNVADAI